MHFVEYIAITLQIRWILWNIFNIYIYKQNMYIYIYLYEYIYIYISIYTRPILYSPMSQFCILQSLMFSLSQRLRASEGLNRPRDYGGLSPLDKAKLVRICLMVLGKFHHDQTLFDHLALESWWMFFGKSSPFMAELFRLVKYYNLPRWLVDV